MSNRLSDNEVRITYTLRDRASIAIRRVRNSITDLTRKARESRNVFSRLGTSVAGFGKGLVTSRLGIAGLTASLGLSAKASLDFEREMFKVKNTIGDITDTNFDSLKSQIKALSLETGISSTKLATGFQNIISSGVPLDKSIGFLTELSKLSKSASSDLVDTSKLVSSVIKNYGLEYGNATDLASAFFQTTRDGQAEFPKLSKVLPSVFPIASSYGESLADTLALSSVVTGKSNTLESFETGYKAFTSVISGASDEMIDKAEQLGISLGQGALSSHTIIDIMEQLSKAQREYSESSIEGFFGTGKTNVIESIFGSNVEAKQLALNISNDIDLVRQLSKKVAQSGGIAESIIKDYAKQDFAVIEKSINKTTESTKELTSRTIPFFSKVADIGASHILKFMNNFLAVENSIKGVRDRMKEIREEEKAEPSLSQGIFNKFDKNIKKITEDGVIDIGIKASGIEDLEPDDIKTKTITAEKIDIPSDNSFLTKTKKRGKLLDSPVTKDIETEDERLARELQEYIEAEEEKTRILEEQEKKRRQIEESATAFSIGLQASKNDNLLEGVAILLQKELQLYIQNEVAKAGISAIGSSLIGFGVGALLTSLTGSLFGDDDDEPTNRGVTYHNAGTNNVYLDKEKVGYTIGDNKQYRERQGYETQ